MTRLLAGRYRLGDQIGAGGFARVHAGVDERLQRPVAVKVLDVRAIADSDPSGLERFLRETRTSASFAHPNAVTTYDAGEDDDLLYMVMELVDGPSLATLLARREGMLPLTQALTVVDQVLGALEVAHRQGIVHRDVKPANILLTPEGDAKLADFGIARRFDELEATLTSAGLVLGTPRYLAPEQVRGEPSTPATDVYALGLIAFEMLSGRVPLERDTPAATSAARRTQPLPDLHVLCPDVPGPVVHVLERALAADRADRISDAGEFRRSLREAIGGPPVARPVHVGAGVAETSNTPSTTVAADLGTAVMPSGVAPVDEGDHTRALTVRRGARARVAGVAAALVLAAAMIAYAATQHNGLSELAAGSATEAAPGEVMPGFERSDDIWGFIEQLEADPHRVGSAGEELLGRLRELLADESPEWRHFAAGALLHDQQEWVADDRLQPRVAEELERHLAPLLAAPAPTPAPEAEPEIEPVSGGGRGPDGAGPPGRTGGRGRG